MIRCWFGFHDVGAPVKRHGQAHWKCMRCHGLSPNPIDVPTLPDPVPLVAKRSRIFWLRGVFENKASVKTKRAAQR